MLAIAAQRVSPVTFRMWTWLAYPGVRVAIAAGGLVASVGGGLLVATSDHLVDPVAFGVQLAIMIAGTVAAAVVWIERRLRNRVGPLLLALALATTALSLEGASNEILRSVGVAVEPVFFILAYLVVSAFPEGTRTGRAERLLLAGFALYFLVAFIPYLFY